MDCIKLSQTLEPHWHLFLLAFERFRRYLPVYCKYEADMFKFSANRGVVLMVRKTLQKMCLIAAVMTIVSCASLEDNSVLSIAPVTVPVNASTVAVSKQTIRVGKINDFRGEENERFVMYKYDEENNQLGGTYIAKRHMVDIIGSSLIDNFQKAHYQVRKNKARYVLTGNLIDLDLVWKNTTLQSKLKGDLQLQLMLTDQRTGQQVWRQEFNTVADYKSASLSDSKSIKIVTESLIGGVVQQLEQSPSFRQALRAL